jgi:hypothetical protein
MNKAALYLLPVAKWKILHTFSCTELEEVWKVYKILRNNN